MNGRVMYKYVLYGPYTQIATYEGAHVLSAGEQDNQLVVWMAVDTARPVAYRKIQAVNTGVWFDAEDAVFVGTVVVDGWAPGERIVWHIFDYGEEVRNASSQ